METRAHARGCYCEVCNKVVHPLPAVWWRWPALLGAIGLGIGGVSAGVITAWMAIGVVAMAPGVMFLGIFAMAPVAEALDYKPKCPVCGRYVDPTRDQAPARTNERRGVQRSVHQTA